MLKKILTLLLVTNITQPIQQKDIWEDDLRWTIDKMDKSVHPEWVEYNNKTKALAHAEIKSSFGLGPWSYDSIPDSYFCTSAIRFLPQGCPCDSKFFQNKLFSLKELEQLSQIETVLLAIFGQNESSSTAIQTIEELKSEKYKNKPDLLLFRNPTKIPALNNLPRFNAKTLLTIAIRNSLKK